MLPRKEGFQYRRQRAGTQHLPVHGDQDEGAVDLSDRRLTKAEVLGGTSKTEVLDVKEYGAQVVIRPLSDGELSRVFASIGSIPLGEDGSPSVSSVDISKNLEALHIATSIGLVDPTLNVEEVSKMKFGVPEYIGMKVLELSGVSFTEEVLRKKD